MRQAGLAAVMALLLSGCASMIDSMWDDAAREQCEQESGGSDRMSCYDRVDEIGRERDRER